MYVWICVGASNVSSMMGCAEHDSSSGKDSLSLANSGNI